LLFDRQETMLPLSLALLRAGNSIAARIAMMAITTSNSIKVKALHSLVARLAFRLSVSLRMQLALAGPQALSDRLTTVSEVSERNRI